MKVIVNNCIEYSFEVDIPDNLSKDDAFEYCVSNDPVFDSISEILNGKIGFSAYTSSIVNDKTDEIIWEA
jgi:hypothetical protein